MRKWILWVAIPVISLLFLAYMATICDFFPTATPAYCENTVVLPVEPLCQHPDFPTGCEATAAVITLRYWDEDITIEEFVDRYLPMNNTFYHNEGVLYGPNPHETFVGDPRTTNSYGCFSSVIQSSLINYFGTSERVLNTGGTPIEELCHQYIDQAIPVILWASSNMSPIQQGKTWSLPSGDSFTWPRGEHCLVLVGYNDADYIFCDPKYETLVEYPREMVEQRYKEMNEQSLVILPK